MIPFLKNNTKAFLAILTVIIGLFLFFPQVNYLDYLAQGDHGRDLYAFSRAYEGDLPYQDYWWEYGPLTPYYYGTFFKLFGTDLTSVLFAELVLILTAGLFIYFAISTFSGPLLALSGALFFFAYYPFFYFTFNHAAGITAVSSFIFYLLLYLKDPRIRFLYLSLISIFLLCLIKINFGICNLLGLAISVLLIDSFYKRPLDNEKKKFYSISLLAVPLCVFGVYFFLLHNLTIYEIRQCLPYLSSDHPCNISVFAALKLIFKTINPEMLLDPVILFFSAIIAFSIMQMIPNKRTNEPDKLLKRKNCLTALILLGFCIINTHEFLVSGVNYRLLWAIPFAVLLMFFFISNAIKKSSFFIRTILSVAVAFFSILVAIDRSFICYKNKIPVNFFSLERTKVFTINPPAWKDTVIKTTSFLKNNLSRNEAFFALPYDPLYYYLTERKSPTRQIIFFEYMNIPAEQEEKIILELEEQKVNWILISNRSNSLENGLGVFGKTHCALIGKYIKDTFELAAQFGDWKNEPGWASEHGTRIFRRK
ncbi:MAG: glycosyltransferase family 39 protein [Candidatus Omnitrophica bacterium]|nr:glycosyltransferase family 39 protein [Candidatus Omnitrophota bacterium]MBU1995807.1 glycosyltransferase family 39 protein [Candidatus Omnitrophota bacterium]MBU4333804.1 glycosyltransferase family 39 protein [Candidatus Omnitrophota bacterium]